MPGGKTRPKTSLNKPLVAERCSRHVTNLNSSAVNQGQACTRIDTYSIASSSHVHHWVQIHKRVFCCQTRIIPWRGGRYSRGTSTHPPSLPRTMFLRAPDGVPITRTSTKYRGPEIMYDIASVSCCLLRVGVHTYVLKGSCSVVVSCRGKRVLQVACDKHAYDWFQDTHSTPKRRPGISSRTCGVLKAWTVGATRCGHPMCTEHPASFELTSRCTMRAIITN